MSWNIPLFLFGGVMLLTAIVGGGLEIERFKIPKVGWLPRILAGSVGGFLILLGVGMGLASSPTQPVTQDPPANQPVIVQDAVLPAVSFTIHDELGQAQVAERVEVSIDGEQVGVLNLDLQTQSFADLDLSVGQAGMHTYKLVTRTVFMDEYGNAWQIDGRGHGTIDVEPGAEFNLWGDYSGPRASVELSPA